MAFDGRDDSVRRDPAAHADVLLLSCCAAVLSALFAACPIIRLLRID